LVAARKINSDQKAQILNKPKLQASLAQLEEQINQYKKFDQDYKARMQAEKAEYEKTFNEKASKELEDAVTAAKAEAVAEALKEQHNNLLLISQFLRLAAIRRGDEEADATLDENKALEGVLAKVYTGDEEAVQTMLKIIHGSSDKTVSVTSEILSTTCKYSLSPFP
jgi:ribosomal protein L16 Arg81 hydroxylase